MFVDEVSGINVEVSIINGFSTAFDSYWAFAVGLVDVV